MDVKLIPVLEVFYYRSLLAIIKCVFLGIFLKKNTDSLVKD